jgi:hypothetical protein
VSSFDGNYAACLDVESGEEDNEYQRDPVEEAATRRYLVQDLLRRAGISGCRRHPAHSNAPLRTDERSEPQRTSLPEGSTAAFSSLRKVTASSLRATISQVSDKLAARSHKLSKRFWHDRGVTPIVCAQSSSPRHYCVDGPFHMDGRPALRSSLSSSSKVN